MVKNLKIKPGKVDIISNWNLEVGIESEAFSQLCDL